MRVAQRTALRSGLTKTRLGTTQIDYRGLQSFWQPMVLNSKQIRGAHRAGADIVFASPSDVYPQGRIREYSFKNSALAASYSGKTLGIVGIIGQSTGASTTGDGNSVADPNGAFTLQSPMPGRVISFNGGPLPHQFGPNHNEGAHTTLLDDAQIDHFINPNENINPDCQGRETSLGLARMLAKAAPDNWDILPINMSVGSTTYAEMLGTVVSPATPYLGWRKAVTRAVTISTDYGYVNVVIIGFFISGFESGTAMNGVQNWINGSLTVTRGLLTADKAITGQTHDPIIVQPCVYEPRGTDAVHETEALILDQISMQALGPVHAMINASDASFATFARHHHQMGGTSETGVTCVHWASLSNEYVREMAAIKMIDKLNALSTLEPYIIPNSAAAPSNIIRVANSPTVTITLSEACALNLNLGVTDPGGKGFCFYTGGSRLAVSGIYHYYGGTKQTIDAVTVSGTTVTLTLHTAPSTTGGYSYVSYASENAEQLVAPVVATTNGAYGLGRKSGIRGLVFATEPLGYSNMDGSTLESPLLPSIRIANEIYQTASIYDASVAYGITFDFCVDMRDIRCVASSSAQTLTDIGTLANSFNRGAGSGSGSDDPTINGNPGDLNRTIFYGFNRSQFCSPITATASTTFLKDAHKASNGGHLLVGFQHNATGNAQIICATCQGSGGGAADGINLQVSATNILQLVVKNDTNVTVFSANGPTLANNDYCVAEIGWTDGGTYFFRWSTSPDNAAANCTYSSPSSATAQSALYIGQGGSTGPSGTRFNGSMFFIGGWTVQQNSDKTLPIFATGIRSINENAY